MEILKKLWNALFGWMKSDDIVTQAVVQALAARTFQKNAGLAVKVVALFGGLQTYLTNSPLSSLSAIQGKIQEEVVHAKLLPEEEVLLNIIIKQMIKGLAGISNPVSISVETITYLNMIRDVAIIYAKQEVK